MGILLKADEMQQQQQQQQQQKQQQQQQKCTFSFHFIFDQSEFPVNWELAILLRNRLLAFDRLDWTHLRIILETLRQRKQQQQQQKRRQSYEKYVLRKSKLVLN